MAAAFFNLLADPALATAVSAGTQPVERVHPEVIAAMKEVGVDLSGAVPNLLTGELLWGTSLLVTMGCGRVCLHVLGARTEEWPFNDPAGQPLERVREIRDHVGLMVAQLVSSRRWVGRDRGAARGSESGAHRPRARRRSAWHRPC